MKKLITYILFLSALNMQAQVNETFADGDFTSNPGWAGDASLYMINASFQLHIHR